MRYAARRNHLVDGVSLALVPNFIKPAAGEGNVGTHLGPQATWQKLSMEAIA
jgi:hypothetical protein